MKQNHLYRLLSLESPGEIKLPGERPHSSFPNSLPLVCCTSVGVKKHKFGFISLLGLRGSSPWDAALGILVTSFVCVYSSWFSTNNSVIVAKPTQHSQASLLSQRASEGTCSTSSERPHLGIKEQLEGWKEPDLVQSSPYGWNGKGS